MLNFEFCATICTFLLYYFSIPQPPGCVPQKIELHNIPIHTKKTHIHITYLYTRVLILTIIHFGYRSNRGISFSPLHTYIYIQRSSPHPNSWHIPWGPLNMSEVSFFLCLTRNLIIIVKIVHHPCLALHIQNSKQNTLLCIIILPTPISAPKYDVAKIGDYCGLGKYRSGKMATGQAL